MTKKLQTLINGELFTRAKEVLGNSKSVGKWFYSHPRVFAGKTPYEVYREGRSEEIYQVLGRIEHGVYS
jgi:hypothetical protein